MNGDTTNESPDQGNPLSLVQQFLIASAVEGVASVARPTPEMVAEAVRFLKEDRKE